MSNNRSYIKSLPALLTCILCSLIFVSCSNRKYPTVSFYYWKTVFQLTDAENEALKTNHIKRLYVRYFDVALKDKKAIPVSPVVFKQSSQCEIVPVVYIKNEVFLLPKTEPELLASNILTLIIDISKSNHISFSEIQIDCDWTIRSRDRFMKFIEVLKKKSNRQISATIRLHQIKYSKETGIPPVDRGVLMYYNMGDLGAGSENSIYERAAAKKYLSALKSYPLPLQVALPIYSWGIHKRNNKVIGIVRQATEDTFKEHPNFSLKHTGLFSVKENILKSGHFFEKGDEVKIESVSADDLKEMGKDLKNNFAKSPPEIIFYDLDEKNLNYYINEKNLFQKIRLSF